MANYCTRCGQKVGWLTKWKCKDGIICTECRELLTKAVQKNLERYTVSQLNYLIDNPELTIRGEQEPQQYKCSNSIVTFDPINKCISTTTAGFFNSKEILYSSIMGYEYKEDGKTKGTYGNIIGAAIVGGVLFGGAGAIVGALTQKRGEQHIVENAEIDISYKENGHISIFKIHTFDSRFSGPENIKNSSYLALLEESKKIMLMLDGIIRDNQKDIEKFNPNKMQTEIEQEKSDFSISNEKKKPLNHNNKFEDSSTFQTREGYKSNIQDIENIFMGYNTEEKKKLLANYRKLVLSKPTFDNYIKIFALERFFSEKDILGSQEYFTKFIKEVFLKDSDVQMMVIDYIEGILTSNPLPAAKDVWPAEVWERNYDDGRQILKEWLDFFHNTLLKHGYSMTMSSLQILYPFNYLDNYNLKIMIMERINRILEFHEKLIHPYFQKTYHDMGNDNINILLNLKKVYQNAGMGGYTKMLESLKPYIKNELAIKGELLVEYQKEDFQKKVQQIDSELQLFKEL